MVSLSLEPHLHRALAEAGLADDGRAPQVLERAGDDLRRRRRATVLQHDERTVLGAGGLGALLLALLARLAHGGDDGALGEEQVGHADRLVEQTAGVAAQVEHPRARALLLQLGDLGLEILAGLVGELVDLEVADVALEQPAADARDPDHVARDRQHQWRVDAHALDGDDDLGVGVAAQPVHRLGQVQVLGRVVVDLDDVVARLHAGLGGGRLGRDQVQDRQRLLAGLLVLAHADGDADAAELAGGADVHLARRLGIEQHAVGIERAQHAVHRRVFDLHRVGGRVDVGLHEAEDRLQLRRQPPRRVDVLDREGLALVVDGDHDLVGVTARLDEDLGHLALHPVERRIQHLLGVDAGRVDVAVADARQRVVDDRQLGQVVVGLVFGGAGCGPGFGRPDGELAQPHRRGPHHREQQRGDQGADQDGQFGRELAIHGFSKAEVRRPKPFNIIRGGSMPDQNGYAPAARAGLDRGDLRGEAVCDTRQGNPLQPLIL
jgi:hypothetical protein